MDLESAGDLAIHTILSKLGPNDTAAVACVSKRFKVYASDDSHWSKLCADELHLSSPQDPNGILANSFMVHPTITNQSSLFLITYGRKTKVKSFSFFLI